MEILDHAEANNWQETLYIHAEINKSYRMKFFRFEKINFDKIVLKFSITPIIFILSEIFHEKTIISFHTFHLNMVSTSIEAYRCN